MNTLMLSSIMGVLPSPLHQAYLCSSGTHGYASLKEMLQCGRSPGWTLLLESGDIRDMDKAVIEEDLGDTTNDGSTTASNPDADDDHTADCIPLFHFSAIQKCASTSSKDEHTSQQQPQHNGPGSPSMVAVPKEARHIVVSSNLRRLPDNFLDSATQIETIDLSPITSLTSISVGFLIGCTGIKRIDLTPLAHLTEIPGGFMTGCTGLTDINLAPLKQVRIIHEGFLSGCTGLVQIDLRQLITSSSDKSSNSLPTAPSQQHPPQESMCLEALPRGFLSGCSGLVSVDINPLSPYLTVLPEELLSGCTSLTSINLSNYSHLRTLPWGFLGGCTGLKEFDMKPFSGISELPGCFLAGCSGLQHIELSPVSHVEALPEGFLSECGGLVSIDLSKFSRLKDIPHGFLSGCTALKLVVWPVEEEAAPVVNTTGEPKNTTTKKLQSVPRDFMSGCAGLESLDLSPFSELKRIPPGFLSGCSGLRFLDLRPLRVAVQTSGVPPMFLSGCSGLAATIPVHSSDGATVTRGAHQKAKTSQKRDENKCVIA